MRLAGWVGLCIQGRQGDPTAALRADANLIVLFQSTVQNVQRIAHLLAQRGDESIRVERELQRFIELVSARIEIGRKTLVGVPIAISANDPHFLASQLLSQDFQNRGLVSDPVDALPTSRISFSHHVAPQSAYDTIERHVRTRPEMS